MSYTEFGIGVEEVERMNRDGNDYKIRFNYPLTPDSVVLEIGGFKGNWTQDLITHLGFCPNVYLFEPVSEFFILAKERLRGQDKVRFFNYGLSDVNSISSFHVDTDRSGQYARNGVTETVTLRNIADVLNELSLNKIDLCIVNCEGGEFSILPRMVESGVINRIEYLTTQFHAVVPDCEVKREAILSQVNQTHNPVYNYAFAWDCWKRK